MKPACIGLMVVFFACMAGVTGCSKEESRPKPQSEVAPQVKERDPVPATQATPASSPALALPGGDGPDAWFLDWDVLVNTQTPEKLEPNQHSHGWFPGELDPTFGYRPHYDGKGKHVGILILHPLSGNEPAKIGFKGTIPADKPVIYVAAGGSVHGDCILRCVVNGETFKEYVVDGTKWTKCEFDLSQFVGKPTELELWNVAGGMLPWQFETCYIDSITFAAK